MKKLVLSLMVIVLMLSSCTSSRQPLYSWSNYNTSSYNYLKNKDEKSMQDLIVTYDKIIAKQKGARKMVPPGIYADYGFIMIQSGKAAEGIKMLKMEVALYPESAQFINSIIKTYEK